MWLDKNLSGIVLILIGIGTFLNLYVVKTYEHQWFVAMVLLAIYLVLYSSNQLYRKKSLLNFCVAVIFMVELTGVLLGFNLSTTYFPQIILILCIIPLFKVIQKLLR